MTLISIMRFSNSMRHRESGVVYRCVPTPWSHPVHPRIQSPTLTAPAHLTPNSL